MDHVSDLMQLTEVTRTRTYTRNCYGRFMQPGLAGIFLCINLRTCFNTELLSVKMSSGLILILEINAYSMISEALNFKISS